MSPIVEDAVDDSDSHSGAPNAPIIDQVDRSEHGDRPLAGERSDTKLSERIEINTSAPGYTCDSNGGRNRDLAGPTRKQSPDHGKPRPEKDNTTDTRIPSSLRKSSSYERSNPGSRRDSGSSSAEPEYFALRPNDYADEKPWSPNKRVTFSLPPSPSHGSGSRSTSPAETPPSSSNSSPIVILSASTHPRAPGTRPPPPSQRSSYNPPPANPVIIDGTACRPPLNRQSQSSSSYRPKDRPSPQIKDGDPVHLASAPASFADLERHERPERDRVERQPSSHHTNLGNGNVIKRVAREHVCPYSSCGGPAFGFPRQ